MAKCNMYLYRTKLWKVALENHSWWNYEDVMVIGHGHADDDEMI